MKHILQISDTHIAKNGDLISECLDSVSALRRLVLRISEVQLEVGPIDAILVSGDISDDGSAESYEIFKSLLKNVFFLGRLGQYKYINMDQAVNNALEFYIELKNKI